MTTRRSSAFVFSATLLCLAGCNSSPPAATDAAVPPDAWTMPDAYVTPDSCDPAHLHRVDGMMGSTVSIDLNTDMTSTRPRDLGPACGNTAAELRWARQEVVEFHVPGTGSMGVHVSTDNTMTQSNFNTLIQVRSGSCAAVPQSVLPLSCFDDVSQTNLRTDGGYTAMGGSTLYFVVTGYSDPPATEMAVDHGMVHVEFTVTPNTPPMLTGGTATLNGINTIVSATATDAEGPIGGYAFSLFNAGGQLDTNGDGVGNGNDVFVLPFDSVDTMGTTYTGHSLIDGMQLRVAEVCRGGAMCTQMGLVVYDQQYATSNMIMVPIHDAVVVGIGQTCDDLHICGGGAVCTMGTCQPTAAATAACGAAQVLTIATPTDTATTATVMGTVPATGIFTGSCGMTTGGEQIWNLTVPAGMYDLALTTRGASTPASSDTELYVRSNCVDSGTELPMGCNDDINTGGMVYSSALSFRNIASGTYSIFVEIYPGATTRNYGLTATLTPVLASGAACDPAGVMNRCATGACGAASHVCP
jgi:hypothetical protein